MSVIPETKLKFTKDEIKLEGGMTQQELMNLNVAMCNDALNLMKKKNTDYSTKGDPFCNFRPAEAFGIHPAKGIMNRLLDKLVRVCSLVDQGGSGQLDDEGLVDAHIDQINYPILSAGYLIEEGLINENFSEKKYPLTHKFIREFKERTKS